MSNGLPPDPYEGEDSPADIAFGVWLQSLDPQEVLTSMERRLRGEEAARLRYFRLRLEPRRSTRKRDAT